MGRKVKPRIQLHERPTQEYVIESIDLDAQGIARQDGKVTFVRGALTGETVRAAVVRSKPSFDVAETVAVLKPSPSRVTPRCKHFGVCGGCSMQHVDATAQLAIKQRALEDCLQHLARLRPEQILPPLAGPDWGYRYRARLSVRLVMKKGGVLVGFHERASSYVADMSECHILPPHVARLLVPLRILIANLSVVDRLPQIELAVGEGDTVMVLRILDSLTAADHALLSAFEAEHGVNFWLQSKGPDTVVPHDPQRPGDLHYTLPEFGVRMPFKATDFTQVNHHINRALVGRAVRLLNVQPGDRVLDLFCGLGNFTLPLATKATQVHGIEGSKALVARALDNARYNQLENKVSFADRNLFEVTGDELQSWGAFDRWLVDPPREGALAIVKALVAAGASVRPKRIVYVSCNPATLARDAGVLVHEGGWRLSKAGIVNMFPHTSHVESIAVFDSP
jgi:23S rRNA (uracil1939-C5)-methyltransferase